MNRPNLKLFFCMAGLLASASVDANVDEEMNAWIRFYSSGPGTGWAIRQRDVAKGDGTHEVWIWYDHAKDNSVTARTTMVQYRFACAAGEAQTYQIKSQVKWDKLGRAIGPQTGSGPVFPVPPMSDIAKIGDLACSTKQ